MRRFLYLSHVAIPLPLRLFFCCDKITTNRRRRDMTGHQHYGRSHRPRRGHGSSKVPFAEQSCKSLVSAGEVVALEEENTTYSHHIDGRNTNLNGDLIRSHRGRNIMKITTNRRTRKDTQLLRGRGGKAGKAGQDSRRERTTIITT